MSFFVAKKIIAQVLFGDLELLLWPPFLKLDHSVRCGLWSGFVRVRVMCWSRGCLFVKVFGEFLLDHRTHAFHLVK